MTNEEAIEIFTKVKALPCGWCYEGGDEFRQALDLAIKALEGADYVCERCKYVERSGHEFPCNECVYAYENHFTEVKEADNDR